MIPNPQDLQAQDPAIYARYGDVVERVVRIREKLDTDVLPKYRSELSEVTHNISTFYAQDKLNVLLAQKQRIQELVDKGYASSELLAPIAQQIEHLREQIAQSVPEETEGSVSIGKPPKEIPPQMQEGKEQEKMAEVNFEPESAENTVQTEPEVEKLDLEQVQARIANIQRLADKGILTNSELLRKAQEASSEFGRTIVFPPKPDMKPSEPERSEEPITLSDGKETSVLEQSRLTPEMAVALIGLIRNKARLEIGMEIEGNSLSFGLDKSTDEAFENIIERYMPVGTLLTDNGNLAELRLQALDTVEKIMNDENRDHIIDQHEDSDIQLLLTFFCSPDQPELGNYILEFLRSEDPKYFIESSRGFVETVRKTKLKIFDRGKKEANHEPLQIQATAKAVNVSTTEQTVTDYHQTAALPERVEEEVQASQPISVQEQAAPLLDKQKREREKQEEVSRKVRGIIEELESTDIPTFMSGAMLSKMTKDRLAVNITETDVLKSTARKFISPQKGDGHHVNHGWREILILVYIKRFGNNMSSNERREFLKIVDKQFAKWQKEKEVHDRT